MKKPHKTSWSSHDDVTKWKPFPRYWPFVRGIHVSLINSPRNGQWRWALMFSLICARINGWVYNREADNLRRQRAHHYVTLMVFLVKGFNCACHFSVVELTSRWHVQGLNSPNRCISARGKTPYCQVSRSIEVARRGVSIWYLTSGYQALLPRFQNYSNR